MQPPTPLLSVAVLAYRSSKTILETLESIRLQTYPHMELIISDDCSPDNTVALCRDWLASHKERFLRVQLLTAEKNTGVSANANRAAAGCRGEWIKMIAADDKLAPQALESYVQAISENPEFQVFHSGYDSYEEQIDEAHHLRQYGKSDLPPFFAHPPFSASQQFRILSLYNCISAPSVLMSRSLFEQTGGYDERIPLCEDWPMWLKITRLGYPFYYIDQPLVQYRVSRRSISGKYAGKEKIFTLFPLDKVVRKYCIAKYNTALFNGICLYQYYLCLTLDRIGANKQTPFCKFLYKQLLFPYRKYVRRYVRKTGNG